MRPVNDPQSEIAFLGAIVGSPELVDTIDASEEHFFSHDTRAVFSAIKSARGARQAVNFHTVAVALGERMQVIGGDSRLLEILAYVPATAAMPLFERMAACLTLRRAQTAVAWATKAIGDCGANLSETEAFAADFQKLTASLESQGEAGNLLPAVCSEIIAKTERMDPGTTAQGFQTSVTCWNRAFGGVLPSQFYAIAGRPGKGKTAMMEQIILDMILQRKRVVVFEKDMSPLKLVERMICKVEGVPFWKFMRNGVSPAERERIRNTARMFIKEDLIRLHSPSGLTADRLCAIARREMAVSEIAGVFLDHVQALSVGKDLREGLTAASLTLRRHVTDTGVPMIVLAHLNRDGDEGRPRASQIKEFDQLYGDVDGMAILWSDKGEDAKKLKQIKFLVAKNRDGGETEEAILFDGPMLTFKGAIDGRTENYDL